MSDGATVNRMSHFPLPVQVMMHSRWDDAHEYLFEKSLPEFGNEHGEWLSRTRDEDRKQQQQAFQDVIETAWVRKKVELALAWSLLAADPARPETIQTFIPQVAVMVQKALEQDTTDVDEAVEQTLNVWFDAANGQYVDAQVSVFAVADRMTRSSGRAAFDRLRESAEKAAAVIDDVSDASGLVVMPKNRSAKLPADHAVFKEMQGKKLPFVVAGDTSQVATQLRREYPHAGPAIDMLMRGLQDGRPVRVKPVILSGDPGSGKSRLLRRLSELLGYTQVYRFDASGISDAVAFSGTARGWGNTTPSVPARAVQQLGSANPWVFIEEIDKAGTGHQNGNFFSSVGSYLDRENSERIRDISLDAELDLSFVNFAATANDVLRIPPHVRDRFRVVHVPLPRLEHLRPLAAGIMRDLAVEADVDVRWMAPLGGDEEAVVAKVWARVGFSIRNLQKIISATVEARDTYAMRN